MARDAKPEDDFVLILIGHGSFDGVEYKFNLVGPDMSAAEICRAVRPHRRPAPADREHNQLERRSGAARWNAGTRRDRRHENRHGERTPPSLRATGLKRCRTHPPTSTRAIPSARWRPSPTRSEKTAEFYESQKRLATEHRGFRRHGHRDEPVREAGKWARACCCRTSPCCASAQPRRQANDPAKRALLAKKDDLEQKIDTLKYQKAAMDPADYKKQLTDALVELAKVQEELDQ